MKRWSVLWTSLAIALLAAPTFTGSSSAGAAAGGASIKAVVVKSWGHCDPESVVWGDLNHNWSSYGTIPIQINFHAQDLCDSFTYAALVNSGADVVILSDPAGGARQYTANEIRAVQQYAMDGHTVIGTFLVFGWVRGGIDNAGLAPVFGLTMQRYRGGQTPVTPTYKLADPGSPLFRDVADPFASAGYPFAGAPPDGRWDSNELAGAQYVGSTVGKRGAIVLYEAATYNAIYVTNMPEYNGSTQDEQVLYNAIIYPQTG